MKRISFALVAVLAIGLLGVASASAATPTLDPTQLQTSTCGAGKVIVNVFEGVRNDTDSGFGGNWAYDNFVRQIVVVETGASTYCAIVRYAGTFTTLAGMSPSGASAVSAGITGLMAGGSRTVSFTADLTPTKPLSGYVGTLDYACTPAGDCPGYVNWTTWYFNHGAGASAEYAWWGWQYTAPGHGTWLNASSGSAGDITG